MEKIKPKNYICPIPLSSMKMKNLYYAFLAVVCISMLASCGILGKKNKSGGSLPNDGQVHGISPGNRYTPAKTSRNGLYSPGYFPYGTQ